VFYTIIVKSPGVGAASPPRLLYIDRTTLIAAGTPLLHQGCADPHQGWTPGSEWLFYFILWIRDENSVLFGL